MISAIVLTKNEEKNILGCLKSLSWCDEIIIIDDFSEDKTIKNVRMFECSRKNVQMFKYSNVQKGKLKVKIYKRGLEGNFAKQRNFGLKKAKGEWVLFIDADEKVSPELKKEIKEAIKKDKYNGFYFKRWDFFGGRWLKHGEIGEVRLLRLAKKTAGQWKRPVHEVWEVKGKIGEFKNPLWHYPHSTINEFVKKIDFYSTLHAKALKEEGKKASLKKIIFYPLGKFLKNYFFKFGFLDGTPGLIVSLMMSFHSFLAQAKLYFLEKK
ncbi:MAG: glycosyltransferase family 2 protein [Microgenomates group bacterium]